MKKFLHKNILIAGQTGSGKSNFMDKLITDFLIENSPEKLRLILIDPKRVQFSPYNGVVHLLAEVVHDPGMARSVFKWVWAESLKRLKEIEKLHSSSIYDHNKNKQVRNKLPEMVTIIDEFSDLMAFDKKFFEDYTKKITALSGITGMYMVFSTSRPSPEQVITKKIRGCFLDRVAFKLSNEEESVLMIGQSGAEKLSKPGSCLVRNLIDGKVRAIQMPHISEEEVAEMVKNIKEKYRDFKFPEPVDEEQEEQEEQEEIEEQYALAKNIVVETGKASATLLQRKLKIGYARAACLIDMLEENGIVGPADGVNPREILGQK